MNIWEADEAIIKGADRWWDSRSRAQCEVNGAFSFPRLADCSTSSVSSVSSEPHHHPPTHTTATSTDRLSGRREREGGRERERKGERQLAVLAGSELFSASLAGVGKTGARRLVRVVCVCVWLVGTW